MSSSRPTRPKDKDEKLPPPNPVLKLEPGANGPAVPSRPVFVPKAPPIRRRAPVVLPADADIDITTGPQIRATKARQQRERKVIPQAPVRVAFQAPARGGGRRTIAAGTVIGDGRGTKGEFDLHDIDESCHEAGSEDANLFAPVPVPFPASATEQPWLEGWAGDEPVGMPAYKDPSLPVVTADLQRGIAALNINATAMPKPDIDAYPAEFEAPTGSGGLLPFQNALPIFYPPKSAQAVEDGAAAPARDPVVFFQLPSHLPSMPNEGKMESVASLSQAPPSHELSLQQDLPMTVDDSAVKGTETASTLSKQYKIFSPHDAHSIRNLEAGRIGELVVYKSGKVKLRIGETLLDVSLGAPVPHYEEAVAISRDPKGEMEMAPLGPFSQRVVCSLDVDDLLKRKTEEDQAV